MKFDGEVIDRCPMIPVRDNPSFFAELTSVYSAREKGLFAEDGGYYDQANCYNRIMSLMDSAIADSYEIADNMKKERQEQATRLQGALGVPVKSK